MTPYSREGKKVFLCGDGNGDGAYTGWLHPPAELETAVARAGVRAITAGHISSESADQLLRHGVRLRVELTEIVSCRS